MALFIAEDGTQFDDGLAFEPGEEGFTRDIAKKHFGKKPFNYASTPNWHLRIDAEERARDQADTEMKAAAAAAAREVAAKARIAQLVDPEGFARA
jgi:hypothetical protein